MRLIDADALSQKLLEELHNRSMQGFGKGLMIANSCVINAPTVEPDPDTVSRPTGYWMRMSDLNESEDDRYKCSFCGNVVHHRNKVSLYTYNSWCGACGANMNAKNYAAYMQGGAPQ